MFVVNCAVDQSQKLKFPLSKRQKKKKGRGKGKKSSSSGGGEEAGTSDNAENQDGGVGGGEEDQEDYNPVKCEECSTEIAVFDKDEVYHFFNVMASN